MNKSEAIRQYKAKHPNAKPSQIVAAMRKQRIKVEAQYVSNILSSEKRRNAIDHEAQKQFTAEHLVLAKQLVESTGSVQSAHDAVRCFEILVK